MSVIVDNFFSAYCALITSPTQLAQCRAAITLTELLQTIKTLWNIPSIDDNRLLAELSQLNQRVIDDPSVSLAGIWLPYRYQAKSRSIHWCLADGHATEPFQDETIERYRRTIGINTLIQPQTSLDLLAHQASGIRKALPSGFIFHLSRCGSTLVSGCLSELDSTCVLSESPVLTELLLDRALDEPTRIQCLRLLIDLQASVFPDRPNIIIKWNAWDIFRWHLIRELYPQVPALFLVRNPVEILASHQRLTGRHMSGDPALASLNPVFGKNSATSFSVLDYRINVLSSLLAEMQSISTGNAIYRMDYRQLDLDKILEICDYFRLLLSTTETERIIARLVFHSKLPTLQFRNDSAEKQSLFGAEDETKIQRATMPLYKCFIGDTVNDDLAI